MTRDLNQKEEDNTEELEGVIETPNLRQRDFNSTPELANFILITKPEVLRVDTLQNREGQYIFRLTTKPT